MSNEELFEEIKENLERLYEGYSPSRDYQKLVEMIENLVWDHRSDAIRGVE